jgi:signal transduction histidine kinase
LASLLIISGFISYSAFSTRIGHRFNQPPHILIEINQPISALNENIPTPQQLREDLFESLLLVNISLFVLAVMLSFWLAKKTLQPIKTAYEEQQRFLGDASHELRTPLAILRMDLENELAISPPTALKRAAILSKLEEVERMSSLVDDILSISRMDHKEGNTQIVKVDTDLLEFCKTIVTRLQPIAQKASVVVTVSEKVPGAHLRIDQTLFAQALSNIIKNAILYNKPEGTVVVDIRQEKNGVSIIVTDSGIGISPEDQSRIFDRFYRVDKSRTRQIGGSGLGLSIAQSAIKQLGGTLTLKSALGIGTTITMHFLK